MKKHTFISWSLYITFSSLLVSCSKENSEKQIANSWYEDAETAEQELSASKARQTPETTGQIPEITRQISGITWQTPRNIKDDTDVSTKGTSVYAYAINDIDTVVNGVTFIAGGAINRSLKVQNLGDDHDVVSSDFLRYTPDAYMKNGKTLDSSLPVSYRNLLDGGIFISAKTPQTITLGNLKVGETYEVQVWFNDSRDKRLKRKTTLNGVNDVKVIYTPVNTEGGLGQYVLGTFVATATTEDIVQTSTSGNPQLNAIQLRRIEE